MLNFILQFGVLVESFVGSVLLNTGLGMVLVLHLSIVRLTINEKKIHAQWFVFLGVMPLLSTLVPGVHKHIHCHTDTNDFLYFFCTSLTFLIQKPLPGCCQQSEEQSQYLKYKFGLYVGVLASCYSVCEVYVAEAFLKEPPCNARSSNRACVMNSF